MMKYAMMILLMLATPIFTWSQDEPAQGKGRGEYILILKKAFIKEKLSLTESEEKLFWPIYDEYLKKRKEIRKALRELQTKVEAENVTDKDVQDAITAMETKRKEEVALDAKLLRDSMPILGAKRVVLLSKVEREFQKKMLENLRERRQERMEQRRGRK